MNEEEKKKRLAEFANALIESAERTERLRAMSNEKLAELLQKYVWADMEIFSPDSDLIGVLIDRLRGEA